MKKRSHAHRFPPTAETLQSLAELLVAALAENERLAKLVDELRREIVALKRETIALRDRLRALGREGVVAACADVASGDTGWRVASLLRPFLPIYCQVPQCCGEGGRVCAPI